MGRPRRAGLATVNLGQDQGYIDFEEGQFCAVCTQHRGEAPACMRTRAKVRFGRDLHPVGGLAAWLARRASSRDAHMDDKLSTLAFEERQAKRAQVGALPQGGALLEAEAGHGRARAAEPRRVF